MDNEEVDHGPKCSACRIRRQDKALRELLSYCKSTAKDADGGAYDAYSDVTYKLRQILDGEA